MPNPFTALAALAGLDPLSVVVLALLAALCAGWMRDLMPKPWMALAYYPVLLGCGLLALKLAYNSGVADPPEFPIGGDMFTSTDGWSRVFDVMPPIVAAGMGGMCAAAIALMAVLRIVQEED
jgi:hypothetical protein